MNLKTIHDFPNEKIYLEFKAGNPDAFEVLYGRFQFMIKRYIGDLLAVNRFPTIDYDDLEQVAQTAFLKALETYDVNGAPFAAYVSVVVKNALINVITRQFNPTEKMSNFAESLDDSVFADNSNLLLSDIIGEGDGHSCCDRLTNQNVNHIADLVPYSFDELEQKIIIAKMEGYSYREIQQNFALTKRQLDKIVRTIKEKCLNNDKDE